LNPRHADYKSAALPPELRQLIVVLNKQIANIANHNYIDYGAICQAFIWDFGRNTSNLHYDNISDIAIFVKYNFYAWVFGLTEKVNNDIIYHGVI
jgi:hypothetical protein